MTSLVVGAGISGIAAAKFLAATSKTKDQVFLSDIQKQSPDIEKQLLALGVRIYSGPQSEDQLAGVTQIVLSPGIPPDVPIIRSAKQKNIPVISEIDLALQHFSGTVIGVTGTNGKSTTTAMTAHILQALGKKAVAAGNIGKAPCEILFLKEHYDFWVLELSSYQLEISTRVKPAVAMFTSFSEDHLKRHKTLKGYFDAKARIFSAMGAGDLVIISQEVADIMGEYGFSLPPEVQLKIVGLSNRFQTDGMPFTTKHDFINATFACEAVAHVIGNSSKVGAVTLMKHLKNFETLPYRFKTIGQMNGHAVINDSKSTNVDAVLCALENTTAPSIVLLGGQGKGESFAPIAKFSGKIKKVICFGESGPIIKHQLGPNIVSELVPKLATVLEQFVKDPKKVDGPLLFSPGCASFDEFKNFEDRGGFFDRELAKLLD
jgi:UDP-N-acetylmuramoylalanine--D-glutamate ligase